MSNNFESPNLEDWVNIGLPIVGLWLLGLVILAIVGLFLSRLTLKSASHFQKSANAKIGIGDYLLHAVYRVVILIAGVYFYFSTFVLVGILIGAALLTYYAMQWILNQSTSNTIGPIVALIAVALVLLHSAYQVVTSIIFCIVFPNRRKAIGRPLTPEEAPEMWKLVKEVAARVGTRPLNAIYLRPETDIFVTERGFFLFKLLGFGKRCLFVGLGSLPGMTQGEFSAILAHEYSHFAHHDTTGGWLAALVLDSIRDIATGLKLEGMATGTNPAWLFVNGYFYLYIAMTLGASRVHEILADRRAALAYGARDFIDGLNHVERQAFVFDYQVGQEVRKAVQEQRFLQNLYTLPPLEPKYEKEITIRMERAAKQETSAFHSHPMTAERIKLIEGFDTSEPVTENCEPVWDLLPAEGLQEEMTAYLGRKLLKVTRKR